MKASEATPKAQRVDANTRTTFKSQSCVVVVVAEMQDLATLSDAEGCAEMRSDGAAAIGILASSWSAEVGAQAHRCVSPSRCGTLPF